MSYLKHTKKVYPIVISNNGKKYCVTIPDLHHSFKCNEIVECIEKSREYLENEINHLQKEPEEWGWTEPFSVEFKKNKEDLITLVDVDLELFTDVTPTKKTLTIPKYLNELAIENKINFSKFLSENLAKELKVPYKSSRFI